ncbi:MAG TPA: O-antigen ligase family protein [Verrucomicrobiae bacterium]|nr:O-antigen ligase family protein [Verrucomicrobiae bacterium]
MRSLLVYGAGILLAVWMGFLLASYDPLWMKSNWIVFGCLALLFCMPVLLRWNHFLMIAAWNLPLTLFFLPGKPAMWIPMVCLSLGISVVQRTINSQMRFISAPMTAWPLIFMVGVILFTAKMTGGIGLHAFGSDVAGGKKAVFLIIEVLGYFALTARPIPPKRARLYIALFLLGGCLSFIGDLAPFLPSALRYIYLFFPVTAWSADPLNVNSHARFAGTGTAGTWGVFLMLAIYGIRGIFLSGKPWRLCVFALFVMMVPISGFRSQIIFCGMLFGLQFFMEGMHRTKLLPIFAFVGALGIVLLIPFVQKMPFMVQRSLAFLPLKIDHAAKMEAEGSKEWRLELWKEALPMVPKYFWLGKGYVITQQELAMSQIHGFRDVNDAKGNIGTVGNWHSGPLSVVIPLGIWGIIAVIWFWGASLRALYLNYRYGDPAFAVVNRFLFAWYAVKIFMFIVIVGDLASDMVNFTAITGLSIALNNGIRRPALNRLPDAAKAPAPPFHPQFNRRSAAD